jgi:hypothetical protein
MRVTLKLDEPRAEFESGQQIPIWDLNGNLADYAEVVAYFSFDGTLILELPDNDAGLLMFEQMARELKRNQEVAELESLSKL